MAEQFLVITAKQEPGFATVETADNQDLKWFQRVVDGHIEFVALTDDVGIYVNEDGKADNLPRNFEAEKFIRALGGAQLAPGDWISGTVVVVSSNDEGETLGTPSYVLDSARESGLF